MLTSTGTGLASTSAKNRPQGNGGPILAHRKAHHSPIKDRQTRTTWPARYPVDLWVAGQDHLVGIAIENALIRCQNAQVDCIAGVFRMAKFNNDQVRI